MYILFHDAAEYLTTLVMIFAPLQERVTTTQPLKNVTVCLSDVWTLGGSPRWDFIQWHKAGSPVVLTSLAHRARQQEGCKIQQKIQHTIKYM